MTSPTLVTLGTTYSAAFTASIYRLMRPLSNAIASSCTPSAASRFSTLTQAPSSALFQYCQPLIFSASFLTYWRIAQSTLCPLPSMTLSHMEVRTPSRAASSAVRSSLVETIQASVAFMSVAAFLPCQEYQSFLGSVLVANVIQPFAISQDCGSVRSFYQSASVASIS